MKTSPQRSTQARFMVSFSSNILLQARECDGNTQQSTVSLTRYSHIVAGALRWPLQLHLLRFRYRLCLLMNYVAVCYEICLSVVAMEFIKVLFFIFNLDVKRIIFNILMKNIENIDAMLCGDKVSLRNYRVLI
jgi:hypothetical protein